MKNRATFVELAEIQGYEANLQHLAKALKADTHPAFRPLLGAGVALAPQNREC